MDGSPGPTVLEIAREASPSWYASLSLDDRAWMDIVIPGATLWATGARVWFDLGDALVKALEPDAAFVHVQDNPLNKAIPSGWRGVARSITAMREGRKD